MTKVISMSNNTRTINEDEESGIGGGGGVETRKKVSID